MMTERTVPRPEIPERRRRDARRRRQARRRSLLLVAGVIVVAAAAAVWSFADGGDGDTSADSTSAGQPTASPTPAQPPKVWVAAKAHPARVWVGGDSLGGELGLSLGPLLKETVVYKPTAFYKESSGICRYDFFDWGAKIKTVSRTTRPDAAVIMMGTNDTQSIWVDGTWISYGKTAWKDAYEKRVGALIDRLLAGGTRRVYWVGMPIMGESWRNSRMQLINRIFEKQSALRPGAEYVDIWDLFSEDGEYVSSWRLSDGVHFTLAGQERLADHVLAAIERDWRPSTAPQ